MEEYVSLNSSLLHNVYDLTTLINMYTDDTIRLFEYLNGKINTFNKCKLSLCLFSNFNYAQFQYPNIINIFLGSIIDHFAYRGRDGVLSIVALCTSHELFHADQNVNGKTYKANAVYSNNVENAAQYNAEVFCYAHRADFRKKFGFNYAIKVQNDFGTYYKASYKNYLANSILGIFRNEELYKTFVEKLMSTENFMLSITYQSFDGDDVTTMIKLKEGGVVLESQPIFDSYRDLLCEIRRGIAVCEYVFSFNIGKKNFAGKPFEVLEIVIKSIRYNPILFS